MSVRVSLSNAGKMSFFRQNSGLQTACRLYLAAFSVPKSGNIMQAGTVSSLRIESLRAAGRAWTDDGGQAFLRMSCHFVIPEGLYGCVILVRSVIYVQIRDSQGCENDIVSECQQYVGLGFNIFKYNIAFFRQVFMRFVRIYIIFTLS